MVTRNGALTADKRWSESRCKGGRLLKVCIQDGRDGQLSVILIVGHVKLVLAKF